MQRSDIRTAAAVATAPISGLHGSLCTTPSVAMVLIHSMDSDEKLQIQTYEEPDAFAASSSEMRSSGIKMTPKVPPQFDGQSSWFEYEDLIDDWLGITTLDPEKHGPSLKNALVGAASFYKSILDNTLLRDATEDLAISRTPFDHTLSKV